MPPRAPADSAISVQLHESALNNTAKQLHLDGRTFTLPELYKTVSQRLGRENADVPEDLSRTARVAFARHDAVRVRLQDGRLVVTLAIAKVKRRRTVYRDFKVRAAYKPRLDGMHIDFVRDDVIEIEGPRLRPGDHVVLQGVFVKLFAPAGRSHSSRPSATPIPGSPT